MARWTSVLLSTVPGWRRTSSQPYETWNARNAYCCSSQSFTSTSTTSPPTRPRTVTRSPFESPVTLSVCASSKKQVTSGCSRDDRVPSETVSPPMTPRRVVLTTLVELNNFALKRRYQRALRCRGIRREGHRKSTSIWPSNFSESVRHGDPRFARWWSECAIPRVPGRFMLGHKERLSEQPIDVWAVLSHE
jgi:hypothetical protein